MKLHEFLYKILKISKFYKKPKNLPKFLYEEYLKEWFFKETGSTLNLNNPQTFNEKIQWLKLYDSTPLKTKLADKYLVQDYVKSKIGDKYLTKILGVWDKFNEIDFDTLPQRFVLKCNHGCGYNLVVSDKSKLDYKSTKKKFNKWMKENFAFRNGLELHYSKIPRKIIAEEYLENSTGELNDYKFYCFNGKVHYIQYIAERSHGYKMIFFDRDWNPQNFISNHTKLDRLPQKPKNLEEIIEKAEALAQDFVFVRVDFYILDNGDIKLGELTFTPGSGKLNWHPEGTNEMMGKLLNLNTLKRK